MKVLVIGASGATGSLVVKQLIDRNVEVKAVMRKDKFELKELQHHKLLQYVVGNISEFDINKNIDLITDCNAVISCLGHNISFKGLFGKPRMLVRDSIKNICEAVSRIQKDKVKLILMSTTGNMNRKIKENYSAADRIVLSLLNILLPPQKDNVAAAEYLSTQIGENNSQIEWIAVRPDNLVNEEDKSEYEIIESPKSSPVFNAGKTSRINVSHFMIELLMSEKLWAKWKFKMPVIYNPESTHVS